MYIKIFELIYFFKIFAINDYLLLFFSFNLLYISDNV